MFRKLRRSKEKKVEWNKHDDKVLQAVRGGDTAKLRHALTKKGTSPTKVNRDGQTALHIAADSGRIQSLEILLALGANVHIRDSNGMTALHHASKGGYLDVVTRLVQAGTTLDTQDNGGQTALHHAATNGSIDCTVLLIQAKATKDAPDDNLKTPLLCASERGHSEVCKELVDRGSAVNAVDSQLKTPLILACENRHKEVVDLLVKRGAKIDAQDAEGHDAAFYADDNPDIAKSLESAPPVATWDIKSKDEEFSKEVMPDSVDYVDAFNSSGEDEAGGHRGSPSAMDEMATPSRAISMPTLTAANNENENEKILHELEEENEMLNEEVQQLQVNNRRHSEKVKKLEAQLLANNIDALQTQLKEEKEKNEKATQEIKMLKEMTSKTSISEDDGEPGSWGDTDDDDLFDLPGLGSSTKVMPKTLNMKSDETIKLEKENEDLREKLKALEDNSDAAELQKRVDELQSRLDAGEDQKRLVEEKKTELSSMQAATAQLRGEVSTLSEKLSEVTSENEELKRLDKLPTFEPSSSSPRFHRLLQEKAQLEKRLQQYESPESESAVNPSQPISRSDQKDLLDRLEVLTNENARLQAQVESHTPGGGDEGGGEGITPGEQEALMDRLEETAKENTRLQTLITKQSKAIAQQTDRARKDKQKYSELLTESESLRKQMEEGQGSGSSRGHSKVGVSLSEMEQLVKRCEELEDTTKTQERLLASRARQHEETNGQNSENGVTKESLDIQKGSRTKEQGSGAHLKGTLVVTERLRVEVEEVRAENVRLKSRLGVGKHGLPDSAEEYAQLTVKNDALESKVKLLSEEVEALRTAQGDYSKRKYTEVLLENRKLKESLQQSQQQQGGRGLVNGDVRRPSQESDVSTAEADKLREKLIRMETRLEDTINIYRQHLLNAVQGNMDPAIKQALLQIIKLRSTNTGSR